jgi:peptidoglycan/LPS O-acetylase OafA/YrhL
MLYSGSVSACSVWLGLSPVLVLSLGSLTRGTCMSQQPDPTIIFWAVIAVVAIASIIFRFFEQVSRNRTLRVLAEKGHPIPKEIFTSDPISYHRTAAAFRAGIILMAIGIATAFLFYAMTSGGIFEGPIKGVNWLPALGAVPFMLGLALFIIAVFERRMPPPPDKP